MIKLKLETKPSLPPNTAARSALPPTDRCLFSNLAKLDPATLGEFSRIFFKIETWAVSEMEDSVCVVVRAFEWIRIDFFCIHQYAQ